ncbi:MAG: hypothetical protein ACKPEN_06375 [Planktothrix sp.]|uniref:hypothetical protein n=1 Tax=Planktothrix sp. TaxID=3088171 RepID=UPI0038D3F003
MTVRTFLNSKTLSILTVPCSLARSTIVAGVIDEMELVEEVNKKVGLRSKEAVSPGLEDKEVSNEKILTEYKAQQSNERGFIFLKYPLFFTASVFVKKPERDELNAPV